MKTASSRADQLRKIEEYVYILRTGRKMRSITKSNAFLISAREHLDGVGV